MRDTCKYLTQIKKCTPTNMHHAIGVMWSWFVRSFESCNIQFIIFKFES
jgi:hypothetical protein